MNMSQGTEHSRVRLHGEVGNSSGSFATPRWAAIPGDVRISGPYS